MSFRKSNYSPSRPLGLWDSRRWNGDGGRRSPRRRLVPMVTLLEERTLLTTPTLITLGDSGVSLSYGQAETFTATVTTNPPSSTIPTGGTVTFSDGSNTLGTPQPLTNGTAQLSVTSLVVGNHVVTASYSGTSTFGGSTMAAPPPPDISTLAGGGNPALRQALYTSLSGPYASVVDSAGDLFIADSGDNVIDEVNQSTGAVTIVAGDGTQNYSGDGGPATAAELSSPDGLALDGSGDLFIADTDNNAIREVNLQTGIINTVAGNGTSGYSGDSGQATAATLNFPNSIALDTSAIYSSPTPATMWSARSTSRRGSSPRSRATARPVTAATAVRPPPPS